MSDEKPTESNTEPSASNLPKAYDPSIIEQRWAEYWVRERLFDVPTPAAHTSNDSKNFTMLLPQAGKVKRMQPKVWQNYMKQPSKRSLLRA